MKYLRKFKNIIESINSTNMINRYFIDDVMTTHFSYSRFRDVIPNIYLFELLKCDGDYLHVRKLYTYNKESGLYENENKNKNRLIFLDRSDFNVVYSSDNLDDVKNYFDMIINTYKYNL